MKRKIARAARTRTTGKAPAPKRAGRSVAIKLARKSPKKKPAPAKAKRKSITRKATPKKPKIARTKRATASSQRTTLSAESLAAPSPSSRKGAARRKVESVSIPAETQAPREEPQPEPMIALQRTKPRTSASRTIPRRRVLRVQPESEAKAPLKKEPTTRAPIAEETSSKSAPIRMPAILLEGDEPASFPPAPSTTSALEAPVPDDLEAGDFPEALGTGKLLLIPRDPTSLYAAWDFTAEQQKQANSRSAQGHLVLLIWKGGAGKQIVSEIHVHPDSRHWFAHVTAPGEVYCAELGYYDSKGIWCCMAASGEVRAPGNTSQPSPERAEVNIVEAGVTRIRVETGAILSPQQVNQPEAAANPEASPGAEAESQRPLTSAVMPAETSEPEPLPEIAALLSGVPEPSAQGLSSMEFLELIARQARRENVAEDLVSSLEVVHARESVEGNLAPQPAPSSLKSAPENEASAKMGFWLQVNAELVIYGATDPQADVKIAGRNIRLRPDGSFSYRFALPDGTYAMPIQAVSKDGDTRSAAMQFSRSTAISGEVAAHRQDVSLKPPKPENIS